MSRLNASTPRSTPGSRGIDDEDDVDVPRKGFSVMPMGEGLGMCVSKDVLGAVRSGTRAPSQRETRKIP
jgi:hypothetical protein